ncbi:hypothetical protein H9P43_008019 [Blastocladiella emersonii ATCC 22665]|nr:hypothetical protein H9P43_008019 [Blastocladiella emersonii ATCC 22665]
MENSPPGQLPVPPAPRTEPSSAASTPTGASRLIIIDDRPAAAADRPFPGPGLDARLSGASFRAPIPLTHSLTSPANLNGPNSASRAPSSWFQRFASGIGFPAPPPDARGSQGRRSYPRFGQPYRFGANTGTTTPPGTAHGTLASMRHRNSIEFGAGDGLAHRRSQSADGLLDTDVLGTHSGPRVTISGAPDKARLPDDEDGDDGPEDVGIDENGNVLDETLEDLERDIQDNDERSVLENKLFRKEYRRRRELEFLSGTRKKMYLFLEVTETPLSQIYSLFYFIMVLTMVVLICIESLPSYYQVEPPWILFDDLLAIYFTIDLLARVYALFRHLRESVLISITVQSLVRSKEAFFLVLMYSSLAMLVASAGMYIVERGTFDENTRLWMREDGKESPFQSILHGLYWSVVTLSTTGYGDVTPITSAGKAIKWLEYNRLRLKARVHTQDLLYAQGVVATPGSASMASTRMARRARIQQLRDQNDAIMQLVSQAQEALNDVNPTDTYIRYKRVKAKYAAALARIQVLESDIFMRRTETTSAAANPRISKTMIRRVDLPSGLVSGTSTWHGRPMELTREPSLAPQTSPPSLGPASPNPAPATLTQLFLDQPITMSPANASVANSIAEQQDPRNASTSAPTAEHAPAPESPSLEGSHGFS